MVKLGRISAVIVLFVLLAMLLPGAVIAAPWVSTPMTATGTITVSSPGDSTPLTATGTITVSSPDGGGGGGGGGGMVGVLAFGYIIDSQGRISTEARAISENAEAYLLLPQGTYCLLDGYPLSFIYIRPLADTEVPPPDPDFGEYISRYFNLGPAGSTFDPPITLIFNYKPVMIPESLDEEDLEIYRWDEQSGQWVRVASHVDTVNNTISCLVSHFSGYAVIGVPDSEPEPIPTAEPTATPEPEPIPTAEPTTTPEPEPIPTSEPTPEPDVESTVLPPYEAPFEIPETEGTNQWLVAGIVFGSAAIIIALAIYLFWYKRILE